LGFIKAGNGTHNGNSDLIRRYIMCLTY